MRGDSLGDLLDLLRAELDIDEPIARRIEELIRARFGAQQIYVARYPKKTLLEQLSGLPDDMDDRSKAESLGISERRLRQLKLMLKVSGN